VNRWWRQCRSDRQRRNNLYWDVSAFRPVTRAYYS